MIQFQVRNAPDQIHILARATQGTGAIPAALATFNVPLFISNTPTKWDLLNPADNSTKSQTITTGTHGARRFVALWLVDVFLFQDGPATLALRERPPDTLTQGFPGTSDTTRAVFTRQVRASVSFRQRWRVGASECRIVYTNGASTLSTFALDIIARAA